MEPGGSAVEFLLAMGSRSVGEVKMAMGEMKHAGPCRARPCTCTHNGNNVNCCVHPYPRASEYHGMLSYRISFVRASHLCVCVIEKESYFPFAYTDTESTHTDLKLSSDRYAPYLSM